MEQHLLIRIASFAFLEQNTFTKKDLIDSICPNQTEDQIEKQILNKYFENALNANSGHNPDLETPFFVFRMDPNSSDRILYSIKRDVIFSYIDYLELKTARKSSRSAMGWAIAAIVINVIAVLVQIYTSNSTEIDQNQFQEIKNIISSEVKQ